MGEGAGFCVLAFGASGLFVGVEIEVTVLNDGA